MRDLVRLRVGRHVPTEIPLDGGLRDSAVMLLLHERDGVEHLLFQVRASTLAVHSGEIGFPGGTRHAGDDSLIATALREVEEEIGVRPEQVEVFGQLDDALTYSSHYRIRPFAGALVHGVRDFAVDAREVHELLSIPVPYLQSPEARGWYPVRRGEVMEPTPAFLFGEHVIWGATARLLEQFLAVIDPERVIA